MRVYYQFASLLRDAGIDVVFGLMGDANMYWLTAFQEQGGRFVPAGHEASAVAMADAYSRLTGQVGVATVTHGPGFTNAITPLVEASRSRSTVLVITGDPPAEPTHMQRLDIGALCASLNVSSDRIYGAETVARDISRCLRSVRASRTPVVLNAPLPVLIAASAEQQQSLSASLSPSPRVASRVELDEALGLIVSSRRPLILAGVGASRSGAESQIVRLAQLLGAPLATTAMAKELFRGSPRNLGIFGSLAHPAASQTISEADCIIAFGASLNSHTVMKGELVRGKRIVQIDDQATAIGSYVFVDEAIVADAGHVATAMIEALTQAGHQGGEGWVRQVEKRLSSGDLLQFVDVSTDSTIDIRSAMRELDRHIPSDRTVVSDIGRFVYGTWPYVTVSRPSGFTAMSGFGSIGLGLAGAIGAAVARPDAVTLALVGDGGFMMYAAELATAVREGLRLVVAVFNDGAYGAEHYKLKALGIDTKYALNNWPNVAEVAASMGADSWVLDSTEQFAELPPALRATGGPSVLDIRIDPEHNLVN